MPAKNKKASSCELAPKPARHHDRKRDPQTFKRRQFFLPSDTMKDGKITISGPEAHHMINVLRVSTGDCVYLFNGEGKRYLASVMEIAKHHVSLEVEPTGGSDEQGTRLHLAQALLKGKKMDLVIQKAVELGINKIIPFTSRYCNMDIASIDKGERWYRIAVEACKQCGRASIPEIESIMDFDHLMEYSSGYESKVIFYEGEQVKDLRVLFGNQEPPANALMIIGSEGGFSSNEISLASGHGFHTVTLGQTILRSETAAIVAMGIMQFLFRNLGVASEEV